MLCEWNKCNFCKENVENKCVRYCSRHLMFVPDHNKIIAKAKALGISVTDVIALINLEV